MMRQRFPMDPYDMQVEDARSPFDYSAPSLNASKKRDWRASVFDRFIPQGDANLADADKSRMTRQGLLQLAIGLQSSNNFGEGLAKGLSGGLLSMNQGVDQLQDRQYKQQALQAQMGDPTGFREQDMLAVAAGHQRGTKGYQDWMRRSNGEIAKASNAAIQYKEVIGADGKKRIIALGPNEVGAEVVGSGDTYGGGVASRGPNVMDSTFESIIGPLLKREGGYVADDAGAGPTNFGINSRANPDVDVASLTPESATQIYRDRYWKAIDGDNLAPEIRAAAFDTAVNQGPEVAKQLIAQSGGDPQKFAALRQQRYDGLVRSNPQKYGQYAESWRRRNAETVNPFVSRSPEEDAAATRQADANVDLRMKPQIERATAIAGAEGKAQGEASVAGMTANTESTIRSAGKNADAAGEQFAQLRTSAKMAQAENSRLQFLRSALGKSYTGTGANAVLGAKKFAASMGFQVEGLGDGEAAKALTNQLALSLRNPAGGEGMPGAMSDADREFLMSSIPSLQNSPQGWRAMIDMKVALNASAIKQAKEAERLRMSGVPIQDIPMRLQEWAEANPTFQAKGKAQRPAPAGFRILD